MSSEQGTDPDLDALEARCRKVHPNGWLAGDQGVPEFLNVIAYARRLEATARRLEAERDEARAQGATLRAALEPFGDLADERARRGFSLPSGLEQVEPRWCEAARSAIEETKP